MTTPQIQRQTNLTVISSTVLADTNPLSTPELDMPNDNNAPQLPPKTPERSKEQKKASFRYIMRYAKSEKWLFFSGVIFLLLSSAGTFVVPLYIGLVIDLLAAGNFDKVGPTCL